MFILPKLPYAYDALQSTMSERTLHHHHDKHHANYVDTLNTLLKDKAQTGPLEEVVRQARETRDSKLFNNACQTWNHGFFWECMAPSASPPNGDLAARIEACFGGQEQLKTAFVAEGVGHFGSGWTWLAFSDGALKIVSTHDADTLAGHDDLIPLLVVDVWEHAYYLDFQQDRAGFLGAWFDRLVNWGFVAEQFRAAQSGGRAGYRYPPQLQQAA